MLGMHVRAELFKFKKKGIDTAASGEQTQLASQEQRAFLKQTGDFACIFN